MGEFIQVLLFAAMPATGNFLGGMAAEVRQVSDKTLSLSLHFAAGVILAVVGIELIPGALEIKQSWIPIVALLYS